MNRRTLIGAPADAVMLVHLMRQLAVETSFMMYRSEELPTIRMLRKRLVKGRSNGYEVFILARDEAQLIGYACIKRGRFHQDRGVGTLAIGVLQIHTGCGVGSQLMEAAISWAKQSHLYRLQLQVHTTNRIALNLYNKFGFVIEGVSRKCGVVNGAYINKYQMALLP